MPLLVFLFAFYWSNKMKKQIIIHDHRGANPEKIRGHFRGSIQNQRFRQQSVLRHKAYKQSGQRHKSIYSLAVESSVIINDLDFGQSCPKEEEKPIHHERKPRDCSSMAVPREHKRTSASGNMQRYEQGEQQRHNREKISLLKRIIDHYNVKSVESNYYSNLMNNLGIKVSGGIELRNRFATLKPHALKLQPQEVRTVKHERSLKIKHGRNTADCEEYFHNSVMKVEAQSINHLIKHDSEDHALPKKELQLCDPRIKTAKNLRKPTHSIFKTKKDPLRDNMSAIRFSETGENCVSIKVNKYKEFLFLINFGHNVYRQLDIQKYEKPFKIYIGPGNNSNLVRAIIKKRFWLEMTKDKEEAHIVWTQLKDEDHFSRQIERHEQRIRLIYLENSCNPSIVQNVDLDTEKKEQSVSTFGLENSDDFQLSPQWKFESKNMESSKQEPKVQKSHSRNSQLNPYQKLLTSEQTNAYINILGELHAKKRNKFSDRLKFSKGLKCFSQEQANFQVVQNHLPFNGLLGNKKAMFYLMKEYCRLTKKNLNEVVPLTFHIKKGLMDEQFRSFMARFNENRTHKRPNHWIMKPGEFSNRGQGITCTNKAEDVRAKVNSLKRQGKSLILQQYLSNPLLYNGRKFDIRTYMLVAMNGGQLRAYWYQDGYIRTSSYPWRLDDLEDSLVHLTNDAVQKQSTDYGYYEPANKLAYSELQRYLDSLPKTSSIRYNFQEEILPKLKQIATDAVRASFQFLQPDRRGNNFEIFGFDFMIDSNFKPWLIEINTNPCLEVNCLVLERVIPSMLENSLRIALDPLFPPPLNYSSTHKYSIPENAIHYNRFQLIFDEQRDGPELVELYRGSKVVELMDDYEEEKEIYEEEGEELNLEEV